MVSSDLRETAPIGIFDSGLGGLSVLKQVERQLPGERVIYIGDTANMPYGDKPISVVRDLALNLTDRLVKAGAKIIIMASGTSTAAGFEAACGLHPNLGIFGTIVPGARAAVEAAPGPIGVIATVGTVQSLAFTHAIAKIDPSRRVVEQGCPRFVPLVESGNADTPEAEQAAFEYLAPLAEEGIQIIILGCTHFPFLLPALGRAAQRLSSSFRPTFVDPAAVAICEVKSFLHKHRLAASPELEQPSVHFECTGDPDDFAHHASHLLGRAVIAHKISMI